LNLGFGVKVVYRKSAYWLAWKCLKMLCDVGGPTINLSLTTPVEFELGCDKNCFLFVNLFLKIKLLNFPHFLAAKGKMFPLSGESLSRTAQKQFYLQFGIIHLFWHHF
jgi:hypothetical protein